MFYDIYQGLCDSVGKSVTTVATEIGLSKSLPSKWQKSGNTPQIKTLLKIADYFNVSVDYLRGRADEKKPATTDGNELEKDVIVFNRVYPKLSAADRAVVDSMIDALYSKGSGKG